MDTQTTVSLIAVLLLSALAFVIGIRSLQGKGPLINNAYLYASEEQREKMDKRPWYRQSGIVFVGVGLMLLFTAAGMLWDLPPVLPVITAVCLIVYAIYSTVAINKKQKDQ